MSSKSESNAATASSPLSLEIQASLFDVINQHPHLAIGQIQDGRIIWANAYWNKLFALPGEANGEADASVLFANARSFESFIKALPAQKKSGLTKIEHTLVRQDGLSFTAEIVIRAIKPAKNRAAHKTTAPIAPGAPAASVANEGKATTSAVDDKSMFPHINFSMVSSDVLNRISSETQAVSNASPENISDGNPNAPMLDGLWLIRDISAQHNLQRELYEIERHYRAMTTYPWGLTLVLNKSSYLTFVSPSSEQLLALRSSEMVGERVDRYVHADDLKVLQQRIQALTNGAPELQKEIFALRLRGADGSYRNFNGRLLNCLDIPRLRGFVINARPADEVVHEADTDAPASHSIEAASTEGLGLSGAHDALTGLVNRIDAERILAQLVEESRQQKCRLGALVIDLDRLRHINDMHGYRTGDELLRHVARILAECIKKPIALLDETALVSNVSEPLLARIGGDQFLVALPDTNQGQVDALAQSILKHLGDENLLPVIDQHIGASIGLSIYPVDCNDALSLMLHAQSALQEARKLGGNQAFQFTLRLAQQRQLLRDLDSEIMEGIERDQFVLFYQPQINLQSGAVMGLEALLRWEHPQRGLLQPDVFMAALHHYSLVNAMTKWTLTCVCEQGVRWQKDNYMVPISVNITGVQFQNPHLPVIVAGVLMKTGLPARNLILEVAEASLIESNASQERIIDELRRLGVRLAIDDFGVGHSSLNSLRRRFVSQVKIDRAFIKGLPESTESGAIVAAIIAISQRLKFQVIAECIETRAQYEYLQALGCLAGQGFYFSPPLAVADVPSYMAKPSLGKSTSASI